MKLVFRHAAYQIYICLNELVNSAIMVTYSLDWTCLEFHVMLANI